MQVERLKCGPSFSTASLLVCLEIPLLFFDSVDCVCSNILGNLQVLVSDTSLNSDLRCYVHGG